MEDHIGVESSLKLFAIPQSNLNSITIDPCILYQDTVASSDSKVDFGKNYAILNVDWMALLLNVIGQSPEGRANRLLPLSLDGMMLSTRRPIGPLVFYTTLQFNPGQPDLQPNTPFSKLIKSFGAFETGTPGVEIDPRFTVDEKDVVLRKTRWSATTGNNLEQILKAQGIDTVVISGLSLSGVVMATVYRLFDLDHKIFVIRDNVLELPPNQHTEFSKVMLDTLLPKMNLQAITLEQALQTLNQF